MIEIKNAVKVYKSKMGTQTKALNDISLQIANKGLVFVVGKSGSGKSTLLNVLGGLDSLTSGEILIGNQDIGKFDYKQFDAYRNSCIGFVFQEFNILEQYNVYENIELALKLQEKNISKDEIDQLLKRLGIEGLGERRVNELSGGQKQRVAIARALIKKPKIILADEPTGNLDKTSSEQIFEILKEIGQEQLVIVVSHDKEAALKYGSRIIEIQDGKVVHDSDSVEVLDNSYLELKKSKLPFFYSLKMALTSLKCKPAKLIMTVILMTMALIFMGFTVNCALFDRARLVTNTMRDNDNYLYTVKYCYYRGQSNCNNYPLTDKNLNEIKNITGKKLNKVYQLYSNGDEVRFTFGEKKKASNYFAFEPQPFFVEIEDFKIIGDLIGKLPNTSNEIVVHKYFAEYMMEYGIMTTDGLYFPKSFEEIVESHKKLKLGENNLIITGIVDDDYSLYKESKKARRFDTPELERYFHDNYLRKGYYIFVKKGFVDNVKLSDDKNSILNHMTITDKNYKNSIIDLKTLLTPTNIVTKNGVGEINSLEGGQVVISASQLRDFDSNFDKRFSKYLEENSNLTYDAALLQFSSIYLKENSTLPKLNLHINLKEYYDDSSELIMEVVGISLDGNSYISNSYVENYNPIMKEIDSVMVFDDNLSNLRKSFNKMIFQDYWDDIDDTGFHYVYDVDNDYELLMVMRIYRALSPYILVVSIIFVLFTYLLFSNFIAISISYCKKEIGILRALGASSFDIIKIFGYESLIIGFISYVFSLIGWLTSCNLLNEKWFGGLNFTLNGLVTNPIIPVIMLIFVIFIALFITTTSVTKITKIKPIEAILNK